MLTEKRVLTILKYIENNKDSIWQVDMSEGTQRIDSSFTKLTIPLCIISIGFSEYRKISLAFSKTKGFCVYTDIEYRFSNFSDALRLAGFPRVGDFNEQVITMLENILEDTLMPSFYDMIDN